MVSTNETVRAIATASGCLPSDIASASYTITSASYPLPAISSMAPSFTTAPGGTITVIMNGSGFGINSVAYWGSSALATQAQSATQMAVTIAATDDPNPGVFPITVHNPTPGGGTSNTFMFELDSAIGNYVPRPVFNPPSASTAAGSVATFGVTLPARATDASASCLNLPSGASCTYSASTKNLNITTAGTTPVGTYQVTVVITETVPAVGNAYIPFPFFFTPILFFRRRNSRAVWLGLCIVLVVTVAALATGCGGSGSNSTSPSPVQTHQVTSSGVITLTVL